MATSIPFRSLWSHGGLGEIRPNQVKSATEFVSPAITILHLAGPEALYAAFNSLASPREYKLARNWLAIHGIEVKCNRSEQNLAPFRVIGASPRDAERRSVSATAWRKRRIGEAGRGVAILTVALLGAPFAASILAGLPVADAAAYLFFPGFLWVFASYLLVVAKFEVGARPEGDSIYPRSMPSRALGDSNALGAIPATEITRGELCEADGKPMGLFVYREPKRLDRAVTLGPLEAFEIEETVAWLRARHIPIEKKPWQGA